MLDEQHDTTTTDPEIASVATLDDSLVETLADVQVIQRITSFHSTPLPDANALAAYAKLLTLALTGCGCYLGVLGHDWLAGALFTTTIGGVVAALLASSRSRRQEK